MTTSKRTRADAKRGFRVEVDGWAGPVYDDPTDAMACGRIFVNMGAKVVEVVDLDLTAEDGTVLRWRTAEGGTVLRWRWRPESGFVAVEYKGVARDSQ